MPAMEYQVNCIRKPNVNSAHEHITHVGHSEGGWCMTREALIKRIDSGNEKYYTLDKTSGTRMYIAVVRNDGSKTPYVKTHADGKWNDNLLAQPQCSGNCNLLE